MSPAEALSLLVPQVQALAHAQGEALRRLQEVEATMVTRAELSAGLTQLEAALRATVTSIGAAVADLAARVPAGLDLEPELARVNAATLTLTQLAEAVHEATMKPPAP